MATSPDRSTLNALLIDDDPTVQTVVRSVLLDMGVRNIELAGNGQAALDLIGKQRSSGKNINLIVCDWDMPVMDGITFLERFRQNDKRAVVIMVTARNSTSDFNKAKLLGADYFFMKPLEATMLKIRLGAAVDAAATGR